MTWPLCADANEDYDDETHFITIIIIITTIIIYNMFKKVTHIIITYMTTNYIKITIKAAHVPYERHEYTRKKTSLQYTLHFKLH